jgi:hypothetical protein
MRHPEDDFEFRQEICTWLEANGISPRSTPMNPDASIANGTLTIRQKVQRDGRDVLDSTGYGILSEVVSVPVIVEPSPAVAEWLRPKCPTCGR